MKLPTNESTADRAIRIALGVILAVAATVAGLAAPILYIAWAVAAVLIVTGAAGFCPLYAMFRFSTTGAQK
jgi:hypothetical protein